MVVTLLSIAAVAVSTALLFGPGALFEPAPLPTRTSPLLPDLMMAPIRDVQPGYSEGRPLLHFSAVVANVGAGDFMLAARRSAPWSDAWSVDQRIAEAAGGFTEQLTPAGLVFSGDRHNHWHVTGVESHRLERVDTGEVVGEVLKQGYCAYDTEVFDPDLPGATLTPRYPDTGCAGPFAISIRVGISVGWADNYRWDFVEQKIDLTGLPPGRYRIVQVADPNNWFEESDETNNETSVEIDFQMSGLIPKIDLVDPE